MSLSATSNFVAGDDNLALHELFGFSTTFEAPADSPPLPADNLAAVPRLASPFSGPTEDVLGQPVGWLSPSATAPAVTLDDFNFDEFLALDESSDEISAATVQAPLSPPRKAALSIIPEEDISATATATTTTTEKTESLQNITGVADMNLELDNLQASLAAQRPQYAPMALPEDQQGTKSPRKRKSTRIGVSPPKRQPMTDMGPIEAMWLQAVTKDERCTSKVNLDFPTTPSPPQLHLDFLPQDLAPYKSNAADFEISPEDLQSMHDFINNKTDLICGTSNQVSTSTTSSNINMATHSVNMKAKRAPLKNARRPSSRHSENTTKVTKKPKAIPKKTQHKRTDSIAPSTTTSPIHPARHRSIDELLSLNFYSLNEQEKCRVMLPMLRSLDPRQLEASLGELPCIQAKGAGHEVHVARAIHDSPPTPEADAELAIKLTTGFPSSPTPATKASHSQLFVPQASFSPQNIRASIEVSEDHGAIRQREALDKAALLQAQGRKR